MLNFINNQKNAKTIYIFVCPYSTSVHQTMISFQLLFRLLFKWKTFFFVNFVTLAVVFFLACQGLLVLSLLCGKVVEIADVPLSLPTDLQDFLSKYVSLI